MNRFDPTENETIAQRIGAFIGNDGFIFTAKDGTDLDDILKNEVWHYTESRRCFGSSDTTIRHKFADGSVLLVAGDIWDYEQAEYPWRMECEDYPDDRYYKMMEEFEDE